MNRPRCLRHLLPWILILLATPLAGVEEAAVEDPAVDESGLDDWFHQVHKLCGQTFEGQVTTDEPGGDDSWSTQRLVMHVRNCDENQLAIPLHVGENRSRTWVLTRTHEGVLLKHDHRHEDGSEDAVTLYGGLGTANEGGALDFPADEETKALFVREGLDVSVENVWTMEIVPGERFSYILRRPGRHFQVDFDLAEPVDTPPPPWGAGSSE